MIKILQSSGFKYVYEFSGKKKHEDFIETDTKHKRRAVFLAARVDFEVRGFMLAPQAATPKFDFSKKTLEDK